MYLLSTASKTQKLVLLNSVKHLSSGKNDLLGCLSCSWWLAKQVATLPVWTHTVRGYIDFGWVYIWQVQTGGKASSCLDFCDSWPSWPESKEHDLFKVKPYTRAMVVKV